ncbi:MAG: hypothetical protein KJP00_15350 [Bacteroidia bacterium]|nr:hypothetical protein [Bacteroidia bacterium]
MKSILIVLIGIGFLSMNTTVMASDKLTIKEAIKIANATKRIDTIRLSKVNIPNISERSQHFEISDHLVIINDTNTEISLLGNESIYKISMTGHLELVGFNIQLLETGIINLGRIKFNDCKMPNLKTLNEIMKNKGHISIVRGVFEEKGKILIKDIEIRPGGNVLREQLSDVDLSSFEYPGLFIEKL